MVLKKNSNRVRGKNLIVLDIGTQFLKALFLEVDEQKERGILRSWAREKVVGDLEKLYPVCQKAIKKIEQKAGLKGEEVFLGIGDNIIKGVSENFCFKREEPRQKVDLPELKYFVQKAQWRAFDEIRKTFVVESGLSGTEVRLVDTQIINIEIDGSPIPNPLDFQGKEICLTVFNTYSSTKGLEDLLNLSSQLGLELKGINPPSYALFHSLNLENLTSEDILIIDIGGKLTEISLIKKKGQRIETRSFNLGGEAFTRTLAEFLEIGPDEAEIVKIKYSKQGVSSEAKKKLEKLFNSSISSWAAGVKVVLDEFFKKYKSLPKKIFLCGGGSGLPGLKDILKKKNFQVNLIRSREFIKIENKTKLEDIPCLALANLALESSKTREFSSMLKRVARLIQG